MPKPQDIFQLAQQEAVRVTASPQAWQSFLYTAAHNYHTTYAVQNLTESPAQAESEPSPSAFALPEFPADLLPQLLAAETSSRAANGEYLTFYNKNPI